ncbi:MAG: CSLREA domain-containing protein [Anaerolinea sp.]|nr:CSLREA domain-containing protein [Anaerolinea sp.]
MKNWLLLMFSLLGILSLGQKADAVWQGSATIVVDTLTDTLDGSSCTLRAAISAANTNTAVQGCPPGSFGHDTISFGVDGVILLTQPGADDYNLVGDLDIWEPLTIVGNGINRTVVDAGGIDRVLDVHPTTFPTEQSVILQNLTIQRGQTDGFGGGIRHNSGSLTLQEVVLTNNVAETGGGLASLATAVIFNSTISDNQADRGAGIAQLMPDEALHIIASIIDTNLAEIEGGGLLIEEGEAEILNSTITLNDASFGSGIMNKGDTTAVHVTIAANGLESNSGHGLQNEPGAAALLLHTLFAANLPTNCAGDWTQVTAPVPNLASDNSCQTFTLSNIQPLLGPLQDNGGPTLTYMPEADSPAIDAGDISLCVEVGTDQRGYSRFHTANSQCDLGAVERDGALLIYLPVLVKP